MKLVLAASIQSTQHYGVRANTGWLGVKIIGGRVERHVYPRTVIAAN